MRPTDPRPLLAGPPTPAPPFPIHLSGPIIKGFGRGSKDLGIPTANIPIAGLSVGGHEEVESGVYYGWAGVNVDEHGQRVGVNGEMEGKDGREIRREERIENGEVEKDAEGQGEGGVWPMVMSIGWNPFYKNTVRSVEVHILHSFKQDFYDAHMNLLILGFIRPEYDYVSKESLIEDINVDIEVARRSLERDQYLRFKGETYLREFEGEEHETLVAT